MAAPTPIPKTQFRHCGSGAAATFAADIGRDDLVLFIGDVGDGDAQVLLLPEDATGSRTVIVEDVARYGKVDHLLDEMTRVGLIGGRGARRLIVVASHPHRDHIQGIGPLLRHHADDIVAVWDSGCRHTGRDYFNYMSALAALRSARPVPLLFLAAGTSFYDGSVRFTVLAPAVRLKTHFGTYGVDPNNASLVLLVEYPVVPAVLAADGTIDRTIEQPAVSILLGADAQTESWGGVMLDFPRLTKHQAPIARRALSETIDTVEPLYADVLKVSHHGSKRGVNYELVDRVHPRLLVVSSSADKQNYYFPHDVTQEVLRESRQHLAGKSAGSSQRDEDWELGILYTSDTMATHSGGTALTWENGSIGDPAVSPPSQLPVSLGSVALVASPPRVGDTQVDPDQAERSNTGKKPRFRVWRFQDSDSGLHGASREVDFSNALRYVGPGAAT